MSKQSKVIENLNAEIFSLKEMLRYEKGKNETLTKTIWNIPDWIVRFFNR